MAPAPPHAAEASSCPLADYFFISGIESSQVYDERTAQTVLSPAVPQTPITIQEDQALETEAIRPTSQDGLPADTTRRRSANRLSENRASIGTIIGPDSKLSTGTSANASNRSSATIKGMQVGGSGLSDADFDLALRKFANERESFLEEISFTTGMVQQSRPASTRPRPRPQRVAQTNNEEGVGNLRSGVGSIRRRISTMQSSLKRQTSTIGRNRKSMPQDAYDLEHN